MLQNGSEDLQCGCILEQGGITCSELVLKKKRGERQGRNQALSMQTRAILKNTLEVKETARRYSREKELKEGRKQSGEAAESVMETEQGWERCYRRRVFRKEAEKGGTANIGFLFSLEAFLVHPRGDLKPEDLVSVYGLHQGWADLRLV